VTRARKSAEEQRRNAALAEAAFERHGGALLRYLLRCRGCAQDADDLAQEVYLELLRVSQAEAVKQPQAYMYRVASHVVYRFKRRRQRESDFVAFDSEAVSQMEERVGDRRPQGVGEQLDNERELTRLLEELPPLYRAIILLQKRDGLSYAQVAERLGISIHTVKKYLHRALLQMRSAAWEAP
jgi:RNA polymerase sigma factor (sigma-70 family)